MRIRSIITLVLAVLLSLVAAVHRWGDSSHAIGLMSLNGGKARHPSFLESGWDRYAQITTARVLPPYRGDVRVVLEGDPPLDYDIRFSKPVVDLGLRRLPDFRDDILYGIQPGDRLALWVLMRCFPTDPVCGMSVREGDLSYTYQGNTHLFCGKGCLASFRAEPERYNRKDTPRGKYNLAFYDTRTGKSVLKVPLIFKGKEDSHVSGGHH